MSIDTHWSARLDTLLAYLAGAPPGFVGTRDGWQITTIGGGANNLLYRVRGDEGDLAMKFVMRDARDRAGREYHALRAPGRGSGGRAPSAAP